MNARGLGLIQASIVGVVCSGSDARPGYPPGPREKRMLIFCEKMISRSSLRRTGFAFSGDCGLAQECCKTPARREPET